MDSKLLLRAFLIVTLFVSSVFVLMLGMNGYLTTNNKGNAVFVEGTELLVSDDLEADGRVKDADLDAWLGDETFFDEEKSSTIEKIEERAKTLMLLTTSVEKDMRIHILDANGNQVSGIPFYVNVEELGTYKDADKDGFIYLEDVKPGQYFVSLKEVTNYQLPEEPLLVEVREEIEYCAIEDISYLIKTEDEIDVNLEDTAINEAALKDEGNTSVVQTEGVSFGIDVSKWNKEIDWKQVKEAGVEFAMIRAGYRGSLTGSLIEDPYFKKNIQNALANEIEVGVYFFTQAVNEREAVEEASMVLSLIQGYDINYPIIIDSEGAGGNGRADGISVDKRTMVCEAFCETIRSAGYTAGIYASKNWLTNNLDQSKLSNKNIIWLAEYAEKPTYEKKYHIWQYTSSGRIPGIEGRVDFNQTSISFANQVIEEKKDNKEPVVKQKDDIKTDEDPGRR